MKLNNLAMLNAKKISEAETLLTAESSITDGKLECMITDAGGNNTEYEFTFSGGQHDIDGPTKFTIIGEWEMMDVAEMFNHIVKKNAE